MPFATLASIAHLTTIAHLASIALSLAFGTPCPSPLILKVPLCLISSLLPMHMFHFSCYSSLFTDNFAPHLLSQNLNVICLALQMAAVLGEGRRKGSGCGGLSRHGRHGSHSRCGKCSSRLFPIQTSPLILYFVFNIPSGQHSQINSPYTTHTLTSLTMLFSSISLQVPINQISVRRAHISPCCHRQIPYRLPSPVTSSHLCPSHPRLA